MHFENIISFLIAITLFSCEPGNEGYKYNNGKLPESPVNLEDFNTGYDDYNSTAPTLGRLIAFCFSTNRNSEGVDFDVIYQPMNVMFSKITGILTVTNEYANWGIYQDEFNVINSALNKINTGGNELGPNLFYNHNSNFADVDFLLLYASDESGNFQINYTFKKGESGFSDSKPVEFLNTRFNDLYPSFDDDFSKIYFCSDREDGIFNLFYVDIDNTSNEIISKLSDTNTPEVFKETVLSSEYDDKCPFFFDNTMVFASNRPGGYGGFDLYYSRFKNGKWGAPVNFGSKINTKSDEYRPILLQEGVDFQKYMMVFSSDRVGGKGGYDLYYVGVERE